MSETEVKVDDRWMQFKDFTTEQWVGWLTGIESFIEVGKSIDKDLFFKIGEVVLSGAAKFDWKVK